MNRTKEQGIALIIPIIAAVVVLIGVLGYVAWQNFVVKGSGNLAMDAASKQAREECEKENDKDICRFLTSWKADQKYRMTSVNGDSKSIFEIDGDKVHMTVTGEVTYDVISIDKATYTKAGDVWYKQIVKDPAQDATAGGKVDFTEPRDDETTETKDTTVYTSLGKEACGDLTCFKYEIVNSENKESKEFIWFDDKDYKLRRTLSQSPQGNSEATFEYDNVTVSVPSPVKDLAEDQYIIPGQSEPQTMPSGAGIDLSQYE